MKCIYVFTFPCQTTCKQQMKNDPVKQKKISERNVSSLEEKLDLHTIFNTAYKPLHQTSLVVQWLRLHAPNAENQGLIPGQGSSQYLLSHLFGNSHSNRCGVIAHCDFDLHFFHN